MARLEKLEFQIIEKRRFFIVIPCFETLESVDSIIVSVQWLGWLVFRIAMLVGTPGIFLLEVSTVRKENIAQFLGGWRGIDRSSEPILDDDRNETTVINMSMGENRGMDLGRVNGKGPPGS